MLETAALWLAGGMNAALFIAQGIGWALLRRRRLGIPKWKKFAQLARILGAILAVAGAAVVFFADETFRTVGSIALLGGTWNVLVASFHLYVVETVLKSRGSSRQSERSE